MRVRTKHDGKVEYGCEQLAANAAWLHQAQFPQCVGVHPYRCGVGGKGQTHWHIGHDEPGAGEGCKAVVLPPRYRPARRSGLRTHPSARDFSQ